MTNYYKTVMQSYEGNFMYKMLQIIDTFIRWITCNEYHLTLEGEEIKHNEKKTKPRL